MIHLAAEVVEWVDDEPQPGVVAVEFTDARGKRHRIIEKSAVIDADLHAGTPLPLVAGLACAPRHCSLRSGSLIHVVDLSPWGLGEPGQTFEVERDSMSWTPPPVYSDLSVTARQAVGLVTFRRWRTKVGLHSADLDALEGHLWEYATVSPDSFRQWYEANELVTRGDGNPLPAGLVASSGAAGIDSGKLAAAIDALAAITYGGLFGGIESSWSLANLESVGRFTSEHGVGLASPDAFVNSLWIDHDWGRPTPSEVDAWRST